MRSRPRRSLRKSSRRGPDSNVVLAPTSDRRHRRACCARRDERQSRKREHAAKEFGYGYGYQTKRLSALRQRLSGLVHRIGSRGSAVQAPDPARVGGGQVTFEPGARTAWHEHPLGQTLIITAGLGWVQRDGGPVEEVRPGDVVWFPPGLRHWHGASPTTAMTHIAVQETLNGKNVDWLEKVSDEQYRRT